MAEIFVSAPGEVAAFEMQATVGRVNIPAELKDPELLPNRPAPIIFASVDWTQRTKQQFENSLDGTVYIYVFGDQMGKVNIAGIAFDRLCDKDDNGLQQVLEYYKTNRASRRPSPIEVSIAEEVVEGFLTAASVRAKGAAFDPGPVLQEYSLEISALP